MKIRSRKVKFKNLTNDWDFFLGDTIWEPVSDKIGLWRLITSIDGVTLEDKKFTIEECHDS